MQGTDDETCTTADLSVLVRRGKTFGTIYADPPWRYRNQATRAATSKHYSTMTVEEICALPIARLAAESAHLHLWTTNGFLMEAPKVIEAWGFQFIDVFVWTKPQMGLGNYWRNAHEILLTGFKGAAPQLGDSGQPSVLLCKRGRHSEKPEQVRALIELFSPGPRLELFGRKTVRGWTVFGNQIERSLFTRDAKEISP